MIKMVGVTDLIIYGAAAELGWYAIKGFYLDSLREIRPLTKEEKKLGLLPFPLDYIYWDNPLSYVFPNRKSQKSI